MHDCMPYKGKQSRIILKKWRFSRMLPIPDRPTTLKDRATQLLRSRSGALVTQRNIFTFYSAVSVPLMTVQVLKDIRWHFQPSVIFDNHPHHCNLLDHHFEYSITWRLPLNLSDNLTCLPTSAYAEKQKTLFLDKKKGKI